MLESEWGLVSSLIFYFGHVDPEKLSDDEYIRFWAYITRAKEHLNRPE